MEQFSMMSKVAKISAFYKYIILIKDEALRGFVKAMLLKADEEYWTAPASSTGRYHPACSNRIHGLLVHVRRALLIAENLCAACKLPQDEKDVVLASVILHDLAKTVDYKNHALKVRSMVTQEELKSFEGQEQRGLELVGVVLDCIDLHMGVWTVSSRAKDIHDYSLLETITYFSDYLSSRKEIVTPEDGVDPSTILESDAASL